MAFKPFFLEKSEKAAGHHLLQQSLKPIKPLKLPKPPKLHANLSAPEMCTCYIFLYLSRSQ